MATENLSTEEIVDFVVATAGLQSTDVEARETALRFVKEAERVIVSASPDWDWLHEESVHQFVGGINTASLDASFSGIEMLLDEDGNFIDHVTQQTFDTVYRSDGSVTGVPSVFSVDYRENVSNPR